MKPQHALLIVVSAALVAVSACSSKLRRRARPARPAPRPRPELGTLALESKPQARVYIDDAPRGMTPLRLDLPAGPHRVRLEANSKARTLTVGVVAGAEVTQSVDLDRAVQTGSLFVRSDPAGAKVLVDNKPAGVTPITVLDLSPGSHAISRDRRGRLERQAVGPGRSGRDRHAAPDARSPAGRRSVDGRGRRADQRLGAGRRADRDAGAPGRPLSIGSRAAACPSRRAAMTFSSVLPITPLRSASRSSAGRVARIEVNVPDGTVNLNAAPWAEVYLDGRSLGETPIANASVTAGHARSDFPQPAVRRAAADGDRRERQGHAPGRHAHEEVRHARRSRTAS